MMFGAKVNYAKELYNIVLTIHITYYVLGDQFNTFGILP